MSTFNDVEYIATSVLLEVMNRYGITYTKVQIKEICENFTDLKKKEVFLIDKSDNELDEILFDLLTDGIDSKSRKQSGTERTPEELITYMLDMIDYNEDISVYHNIVDPSCGTGTFTKQILDRFISGLYKNKKIDIVKEKLLNEKLIRAYDVNPSNVYITKIVMVCTLIKTNLIKKLDDIVEWIEKLPVYCKDFLCIEEKTDFVIGNPPYIRVQNMPVEYKNFIRENFVSATGRFDIFTCFMEKADTILNENGRMCLITSNKYLTANYGAGIRRYLSEKGHVRKIVDLYDTKFFGAAVLPAIIMCENSEQENYNVDYIGIKSCTQEPQYHCLDLIELFRYVENEMNSDKNCVLFGRKESQVFEISHSKVIIPLGEKPWNFSSSDENIIKSKMDSQKLCLLADIFDVCVGIKTTADSVFVKPMTKKFVEEYKLESDVIYPLIQSFNVNKWNILWGENEKDRYILYPHKEIDGTMVAISLEEIPKTKQYLEDHEDILKNRSYLAECKSRMWYECWVPQKLSKFRQMKIVTRDIVSGNSFALDELGRLCQGNTFFLVRKDSVFSIKYKELSEYQYYCFMLGVLNSKAMEYYQKMISGCLYSGKYRYTTSNLNRWPIPKIEKCEAIKIAEYVNKLIFGAEQQEKLENDIDNIIYNSFKLDKEDILKMECFLGKEKDE